MLAVSIAVTSLNVSVGLGLHFKEIPAENLESFLLYSTIASVPNILAAAWSKTSFIITLARLMMDRWQRILLWTIGIVLNVPMTVLAVATFLRCNPPEKNWKPMIEGTCWPPEAYTKFGIFAGGKHLCLGVGVCRRSRRHTTRARFELTSDPSALFVRSILGRRGHCPRSVAMADAVEHAIEHEGKIGRWHRHEHGDFVSGRGPMQHSSFDL